MYYFAMGIPSPNLEVSPGGLQGCLKHYRYFDTDTDRKRVRGLNESVNSAYEKIILSSFEPKACPFNFLK